jgi:hypothetical protein
MPAERPVPGAVPAAADLDRIEKQLEAPKFDDRKQASAELDTCGPNAVAMVKERIKKTGSPEVSKRFNEFLQHHAGAFTSPLVLRGTRGVAVLEAIGTPEARKVLARLAGNRPGDQLSVDAAAALVQLEKPGGQR